MGGTFVFGGSYFSAPLVLLASSEGDSNGWNGLYFLVLLVVGGHS